jgi:hypothetical protein
VTLTIGVPFLIGAVTLMVQTRTGSRREVTTKSSLLAALEQSASRIALGRLSVLVVGESGVGKERFAERIHEMSPRRAAPFVRLNCSAISEPLLDAELFGNETTNKPGMLELADGGTAFLSDVDQLPPGLQQKLLRAIEDAAVRRLNAARAAGRHPLRRLDREGPRQRGRRRAVPTRSVLPARRRDVLDPRAARAPRRDLAARRAVRRLGGCAARPHVRVRR